MKTYNVVRYRHGKIQGVISGMGKNCGTWDSTHSRTSAYKYAAIVRREHGNAAGTTYKVEEST